MSSLTVSVAGRLYLIARLAAVRVPSLGRPPCFSNMDD